MPNTSSARKALRQNITRRTRNAARKTAYKKSLQDLQRAAAEKKAGYLSVTYQALDKAARTGVISKNKVARLKSHAAKTASSKASA